MRALFHLIGRFRSDQRGNIAVLFMLALLPILSAIGCAIDYSRAAQLRSKLQAAADAARVGSGANVSPGFVAAGSMTTDGPIPVGVTDATNIFKGNMSGVGGYTLNSVTPTVATAGSAITSVVQYSADISTMFLGVVGKRTITVTGTSNSHAN